MSAAAVRTIETAIGRLAAWIADDGSLRTAWADDGGACPTSQRAFGGAAAGASAKLDDAVRRLDAYFAGHRVDFDGLPLPSGTPFRGACWRAAQCIGVGQTISYAELATMAKSDPRAAQAAGQAMRHNPVPVIVPCHRVVASDGSAGGYAGSNDPNGRSVRRKLALIEFERLAFRELR